MDIWQSPWANSHSHARALARDTLFSTRFLCAADQEACATCLNELIIHATYAQNLISSCQAEDSPSKCQPTFAYTKLRILGIAPRKACCSILEIWTHVDRQDQK